MGVPLTSLTDKPVQFNTFSYGGDDTQLGYSGPFGTITQWDLNSKEDCFKSHFIFFVKQAFVFLDKIGVGQFLYGISGFEGKLKKCERYQTGLERNRQAREKIVNALGGAEVCRRIPSITMNAAQFPDYLRLDDDSFQGGQWVVQGEDPAGRKFIVMRLNDRQGNLCIATAHQRYRETSINGSGIYQDGSNWTLNFDLDGLPVCIDTDRIAEFIEKVRTLRHEQFSIATKP